MNSCNQSKDTTNELKDLEHSDEDNILTSSSGRDSGISNASNLDSFRMHEKNDKIINQVEKQLEKIVLSSHKELQDAKQKLEELRLLRFEEKNYLKKEIEYLYDKVDGEERNTSVLEETVKTQGEEKKQLENKLEALIKEQTVANQINMMQEQEIVRLEMKLKEDEFDRVSLSKQLDHQRRTIVERDKIRIQQDKEIYSLSDKLSSFEQSVSFYKNESSSYTRKVRNYESEIEVLRHEVSSLTSDLETFKKEVAKSRLLHKQLEITNSRLEDEKIALNLQLEEKENSLSEIHERCNIHEEESRRREIYLQQELDQTYFGESKLKEKYNSLKVNFEQLQIEKNEQDSKLKSALDKLHNFEEELSSLNDEKNEIEFELTELQHILNRHIKEDMLKIVISPSPTDDPVRSHSPITSGDVNDYFLKVSSKLRSLQSNVTDISKEKVKKESIIESLNITVDGLKHDLEKVHNNLVTSTKQKESIEDQYQRFNTTLKMQERDIERKEEENEHLKCLYEQSQQHIRKLENDITLLEEQISHNKYINKNEKEKLKVKLNDLEKQNDVLSRESFLVNSQFTHEINKLKTKIQEKNEKELNLKETLETKDDEIKALTKQLNALIDDNKSLAQRLIHLESYSDKLMNMVEIHENEKDKLKEKLHNEIKDHRSSLGEKTNEADELARKINELNRSLDERHGKHDKLYYKLKKAKEENKAIERRNNELQMKVEELEQKLKQITDSHIKSERKTIALNEEIDQFTKRFEEQTRNVEDLFKKITEQEEEKMSLKENLLNSKKRMDLKESLIAELSKKSTNAIENYNTLKLELQKFEIGEKDKLGKMNVLENELVNLERFQREQDSENLFLKEQVKNFQQILARTEDEKDTSMNELAHTQRKLESERIRNEKILNEARENMKKKNAINTMQIQLTSMKDELDSEKRRRERLEAMFTKRDDQVTMFKSTFDESLNTLTHDTKNIKHILNKSLQKIDKQIKHSEGLVSDSECTDTDVESDFPFSKNSSNKYLNLPTHHSTKLMDTSLDRLYGTRSKPSLSLNSSPDKSQLYSPIKIYSNLPVANQDIPVRDRPHKKR